MFLHVSWVIFSEAVKRDDAVKQSECLRTVRMNVDHGTGSVAAESPVSDFLYELRANWRFQVPMAAPD